MYQLKTQQNDASIEKFLSTLSNEEQISDCKKLLDIFSEVSSQPAKMWGTNMIGFGKYSYTYASRHSGEYFRIGFSPKKSAITLYLISGLSQYEELLGDLGKHTITGKSCIAIKNLDTLNVYVLQKLLSASLEEIKLLYP